MTDTTTSGDDGSAPVANAPAPLQPQLATHHRKIIDLGSTFANLLSEERAYRGGWRGDWRDSRAGEALNPSKRYKRYVLDVFSHLAQPEMLICSKYNHTAINKSRCPVNVARWSPEGRYLITGAMTGEFTIWNGDDFAYNRAIQAHEVGVAVRSLAWSKSGDFFVSGDNSGIVKIWNHTIRNLKDVQAHTAAVRGLSFSPADTRLATCSDDLTVRVFDFNTAREEQSFTSNGDVKAVDWHPSRGLILSAGRDNAAKLWSPRTGRCLRTITGHKQTVNVASWHPRCQDMFLTASRDETVRVYDLRMLRDLAPGAGDQTLCVYSWKAHEAEVYAAAWHPYSSEVLVTGGFDGSMAFWILGGSPGRGGGGEGSSATSSSSSYAALGNTGPPVRQAYIPAAHESSIWDLDWNPLGHMLASASNDHTAKFWSRPKPGDSTRDLYRGYTRDLGEADVLRAGGVSLPVSAAERAMARETRTMTAAVEALAKLTVPGVGVVGKEYAEKQAGVLLAPPTDTAAASALAWEAALTEQRRAAALMESVSESRGGGDHHHHQQQQMSGGAAGRRGERDGGGDYQRGGRRVWGDGAGEKPSSSSGPPPPPLAEAPGPRYRGKVRKWDDGTGYGFVKPFDASLPSSLFAHASNVDKGRGVDGGDSLALDTVVEFSLEEAEDKKTGQRKLRAVRIVALPPGTGEEPSGSMGAGSVPMGNLMVGPPPPLPPPHPGLLLLSQMPPEIVQQLRTLVDAGRFDLAHKSLADAGLDPNEIINALILSSGGVRTTTT